MITCSSFSNIRTNVLELSQMNHVWTVIKIVSDLDAHYFFVCGCIPTVYIYINNYQLMDKGPPDFMGVQELMLVLI